MSKLQGAEHNKKGRGLEYLYLSVHDEDRDGEFSWRRSKLHTQHSTDIEPFDFSSADLTRCNVWILDGDLYHKGLLKFALSPQSLPNCLAVFMVDMSRPWTIMESLQKWASVLRDHVDKLKIVPEEMRELEQKSKLRLPLNGACKTRKMVVEYRVSLRAHRRWFAVFSLRRTLQPEAPRDAIAA